MRYSPSVFGAVALYVSEVVAFPAAAIEYAARSERDVEFQSAVQRFLETRATPGFDAKSQYVSTSGEYAFVAPDLAGGDNRGPCPGLNAMANHGYIPHNGVASIDEFITGTYEVFGMGKDLGAFLALYGALIDGDGTQWSIGGPTAAIPGLLGLAQPQGISGSHNKYEGDVSPSRPDLYEYGNDYKVIISQFQQLFDMQPDAATANYDLSVLTPFRASRFNQSINNNPYFFNGPFSGVLVQPAAYTFIYRFMGNKSAEYPEGILNQEVLKSFFSISGTSGDFVWTEGNERIPDNWYKRAIGDEYTIPYFLTDVIAAAAEYPQFLDIGGNTGKTNTFTGVDITDLTGGVFNAGSLLEGNNLECFLFQASANLFSDLVKGILSDVSEAISTYNSEIGGIIGDLGCPTLSSIDTSQFSQFPGATGVV